MSASLKELDRVPIAELDRRVEECDTDIRRTDAEILAKVAELHGLWSVRSTFVNFRERWATHPDRFIAGVKL